MNIDFFKYSDNGEREVNEDSVGSYSDGNFYAFALCDGLGGHGKGEVASQTAVQALLAKSAKASHGCDFLPECFEFANEAVLNKQKEDSVCRDMKTTAVFLVLENGKASWGHIGDSRLYFFRKNKYVERTLDHSVPQMLAATGEIKEKDIRHHEDRNKLLRCIPWMNKKYDIDETDFNIQPKDCFLIMSDGFWDWVDEKTMKKCVKKGKNAEETGKLLINEAFKNGKGNNMDNLSVIVVKIM
ncbi:MAG: PP2C family protein-serine/threonine phosphatase [Eubacterium sp.]